MTYESDTAAALARFKELQPILRDSFNTIKEHAVDYGDVLGFERLARLFHESAALPDSSCPRDYQCLFCDIHGAYFGDHVDGNLGERIPLYVSDIRPLYAEAARIAMHLLDGIKQDQQRCSEVAGTGSSAGPTVESE